VLHYASKSDCVTAARFDGPVAIRGQVNIFTSAVNLSSWTIKHEELPYGDIVNTGRMNERDSLAETPNGEQDLSNLK
jgi:hypothetical protein